MTVRVVLADDHEGYRAGLARAVHDDPRLELVAEASDGVAALELVSRLGPDLAVIDVRMPGVDGFAVCQRLAGLETTRVVLITDDPSDALRARAAELGAAALLDKSASRDEICGRLKEIADDLV